MLINCRAEKIPEMCYFVKSFQLMKCIGKWNLKNYSIHQFLSKNNALIDSTS